MHVCVPRLEGPVAPIQEGRKPQGRFLRDGALLPVEDSVWGQLERVGLCDDMEFFKFLGLSRESFNKLVIILTEYDKNQPLKRDCGKPKTCHLS